MIRDDGLLDSMAESPMDDEERMGGVTEPPKPTRATHPLDKAKPRATLKRLKDWYDQEWERQAHNRYQQALDCDYYDSLQWTEEDAQELLERGQAPCVYNEIKPSIDWLLGTERRTKIDYRVLPRRKEEGDQAEVKTKLLKYLSDVNHEPMARSRAFADAVKAGVGWLEVGVRGDRTDEPVYYRHQSWRHMLYDSNAVEMDLSDARYVFRWKYIDKDVASAYFPDRKDIIAKAAQDRTRTSLDEDDDIWYLGTRVTEPGYDYGVSAVGKYRPYDGSAFAWTKRDRVRIFECWYREPATKKFLMGSDLDGSEYTPDDPEQQARVQQGQASIYDKVVMQVRCAIFVDNGLLWEGPSPYNHDRFPFVAIWAHRRQRDNAPYGPIRGLRDAQDGMNKRASKALWILSANQVILDEGAVEDIEELRDEAARPDGIIIKRRGHELQMGRDNQLAEQHLRLMDRDANAIRQASGVTSENLGRETNADSGKAIIARQEQGSVVTTELFDNLRYSVQLAGEIELSLIEQYYTQPKVVRLVGERGNATFVEINQPGPQGERLNDITTTKADFIVSAQDYRDSLRQAMFESLFDITGRLAQMSPEIAFKLLDLVVETTDLPNRDELVSRIRELNGMRDPERDPTPEEQAQQQEQAQLQQMQQQIAIATAKAQLAELEAKADKLDAEAVAKRLTAIQDAVTAAQTLAVAPAVGPVADELMRGAGYADQAPSAAVRTDQGQRKAQQYAAEQQAQQFAQQQAEQQAMVEQQAMQQPAPMPPTEPPA